MDETGEIETSDGPPNFGFGLFVVEPNDTETSSLRVKKAFPDGVHIKKWRNKTRKHPMHSL